MSCSHRTDQHWFEYRNYLCTDHMYTMEITNSSETNKAWILRMGGKRGYHARDTGRDPFDIVNAYEYE